MYYIPKGKPMHEKLSTSFVRMEGLLEELKSDNFSGYVLLNFPQTSGFLFILDGQVINAAEITEQNRRAGIAVQEQLVRLSQQSKGTISVYHLQKEIVFGVNVFYGQIACLKHQRSRLYVFQIVLI